jgi:hypothetical protein
METLGPFVFNGIRFALGSISLLPLIYLNEMKNKSKSIPNLPPHPPPSAMDLQKKFGDEYLELCKKHKLQLDVLPQWKRSGDTGTFSLVLQLVVVQLVAVAASGHP